MKENLNPLHVQWHKNLHATLTDGAMWAVPCLAVIFQKRGDKMVVFDRMPYLPEMSQGFTEGEDVPASPSELYEFQQRGIDKITEHFNAAGIEVEDLKLQNLEGLRKYER